MTSQLVTLQVRRGTEAGSTGWFQLNPRLTAGEPGFASDTGILKIGNGSSLWNDLPSINGFTFSGPAGSVLYYNGTSVTGTTGLQYSAGVGMTMDGLFIRGLNSSVAIGNGAGATGQQTSGVAIGTLAGSNNQQDYAVAIGNGAGTTGQSPNAVAIGSNAGSTKQKNAAIAIGAYAGQIEQKFNAVAIGANSGSISQQDYAVAIGDDAGSTNQGLNAIAIGRRAGVIGQAANTIILNATGLTGVTGVSGQSGAFYVAPVRSDPTQTVPLCYNTTTYEIVQGNPFGPGFTFTGSAGSVLYYDGSSVTGSTGTLGISGSVLSTSLSIVPIGSLSLGSSGSTWSALYADSIVDSAGSSGEASQVLTAGPGGQLAWAAGPIGVVEFSGPTGSVLYYDGSGLTGSTGILGISGPELSTSLSIVPIGDVSLGSSGSTWSALYADSIVDSAGSSGEASQVLTAGSGGQLAWAASTGLPSGLYFRTINNRLEYNFGGTSWGTIYDTLFYPIDSNMQVVHTIDATTSGSYALGDLTGINAVYIDYRIIGGGGAGGYYATDGSGFNGGTGGNGYIVTGSLPLPVKTSDTLLSWVIGNGGATAQYLDGEDGGDTVITVTNTSLTVDYTVTAGGGKGGKEGSNAGVGADGAGGTAGNSSVGGGGMGGVYTGGIILPLAGVTGGVFIQIRSAGYTSSVIQI